MTAGPLNGALSVVADRDGAAADRHPGLDLGRAEYVVA
jgi:hypothetical protein